MGTHCKIYGALSSPGDPILWARGENKGKALQLLKRTGNGVRSQD